MRIRIYTLFACSRQQGPLDRYVKLRVAHAPGMPGTFSPQPPVSDLDIHHGTCVKHVPWCMPGSLTSGFLWIRWRGKRSRHSRRMCNPQFYVSGKRPMTWHCMLYTSNFHNSIDCLRWCNYITMTSQRRDSTAQSRQNKDSTLQWRHNGRDSVSNHQPHDCLLKCLFRRRS